MSGETKEYLRRNELHAASLGMKANAEAALRRLDSLSRQPMWLVRLLEGIVDRGEQVCREMSAHRDEIRGAVLKGQATDA